MTERECELIRRLTDTLERMHLDDYLEYVSNRRRMIANNLIYGMVRGLGFTIGFTVLGALVIVSSDLLKKMRANRAMLKGGAAL